jgi:ribosomal protein S18 acetylase RimI-like enzyme
MLTIRAAETHDAKAIARVHVDTWQSAYADIIPRSYLDSLSVESRTIGWVRLLERSAAGTITLVSEDHDRNIVGFVCAGPLRHGDARFQAEISSLYVLGSHQRAGHGRRLFMAASNRLSLYGLSGLFVWVLADNPARRFYEHMGGEVVTEAHRNFAGKPLTELGYGWPQTPNYQ